MATITFLVTGFRYELRFSKAHVAALTHNASTATPSKAPAVPITLESLFGNDFPNVFKSTLSTEVEFEHEQRVKIKYQEYEDFQTKSSFVGVYVPDTPLTFRVCVRFANSVPDILKQIKEHAKMSASFDGGESTTTLEDLVFSGRVFVYHETLLTLRQKDLLTDYYVKRHLKVQFRGLSYLEDTGMWRKLYPAKPTD